MKKTLPVFLMIFISACSFIATETASTVVSSPQNTADPCAQANIIAEAEKAYSSIYEFQDIVNAANFTPQWQLINPILELQRVRRDFQLNNVPTCLDAFKNSTVNYMNAVIFYLTQFMGGNSKENIAASINNSQILWQSVMSEYQHLEELTGSDLKDLPELMSVEIAVAENTPALVENKMNQAVNIRSAPDLNASILATLDAGATAQALGRTEAGDWIQVSLNGATGWVSSEFISLNTTLENIPIVTNP